MTEPEWLQCVDLLSDEFNRSADKFKSNRWRERFIHVPYRVMRAAIEDYCDSSHQPPTVNGMAEKLPKGYGPRRDSQQHAHAWETLGETIMCQSCGRHDSYRCGCLRCQCNHASARPESESSDEWWHCSDCDSSFRAAPGRRDQYAKRQTQAEAEALLQGNNAQYQDSDDDSDVPF